MKKRERTVLFRSLRAVSLVITLVSFVTFSSIGYSVYEDYAGVVSVLNQGPSSGGIYTRAVSQGDNVTIFVNMTLPNRGLYPLTVGFSCLPTTSTMLSCTGGNVTIPAGGVGTLRFRGSVGNLTSALAAPDFRGKISLRMATFASLQIGIDLGSIIRS